MEKRRVNISLSSSQGRRHKAHPLFCSLSLWKGQLNSSTDPVSTWGSYFGSLWLLLAAIRIFMLVKTVPSKWTAPTAFIKIPAWLVAGKENIASLTDSRAQSDFRTAFTCSPQGSEVPGAHGILWVKDLYAEIIYYTTCGLMHAEGHQWCAVHELGLSYGYTTSVLCREGKDWGERAQE